VWRAYWDKTRYRETRANFGTSRRVRDLELAVVWRVARLRTRTNEVAPGTVCRTRAPSTPTDADVEEDRWRGPGDRDVGNPALRLPLEFGGCLEDAGRRVRPLAHAHPR